jgi:predicted RNA-binding protein with PIN domain
MAGSTSERGGAVAGLRRELALGGGGPRPADLVAGAQTAQRGSALDGLAALDAMLAVPSVHLIVDGYNVSKTGYPDLPLADQRTRLVGQLAALAARTSVEITVVFDGAGVVTAPPRGSRGVRVLFSDPGVLADDVIRSLVAVEPEGRPIVVATSDRAVVDSVRKRGAYTVPSAAPAPGAGSDAGHVQRHAEQTGDDQHLAADHADREAGEREQERECEEHGSDDGEHDGPLSETAQSRAVC